MVRIQTVESVGKLRPSSSGLYSSPLYKLQGSLTGGKNGLRCDTEGRSVGPMILKVFLLIAAASTYFSALRINRLLEPTAEPRATLT